MPDLQTLPGNLAVYEGRRLPAATATRRPTLTPSLQNHLKGNFGQAKEPVASARFWILGLGLVLVLASIGLFIWGKGTVDSPTIVEFSLLVLQVGIGILVIEGIIGSALTRDNRRKADYSLRQLNTIATGFRPRALVLISELAELDETSGTELVEDSFAQTFPTGRALHPKSVTFFAEWMRERFARAHEEFRHLTHFLDHEEVESLRKPIERAELAFSSVTELRLNSKSSKQKWTALMFALDQIHVSMNAEIAVLSQLGIAGEQAEPPAKVPERN
jgi:hypothetical protein